MSDPNIYLKEKTAELNIIVTKDTGWSDAVSGGRCIKDFYRDITFKTEPSSEDLQKVCSILAEKYCPGWTGVRSRNIGDNIYKFSTTWDSSD